MDKEKSHGNAYHEKTDRENYSGDDKQLIEQIPIKDTPFTAVKADNKWFLTLGKYRLTENLITYNECEEEAHNMDWFRIMGVIQIMIEQYDEITHKPAREHKNQTKIQFDPEKNK